MKIGILTLPLHTNYGGNLQAYALMTVLKEMGHEVWLINRDSPAHNSPVWRTCLAIVKRLIQKIVLRKQGITIFVEYKYQREYSVISQYTQPFINKYIQPQTKPIYFTSELARLNAEYRFDAVIVGSDQIWRPAYTPNIEDYFLKFLGDSKIKRVSYAASFGKDNLSEFSALNLKRCRKSLELFEAVSVREDSGVKLCREHFGVEAQHVLDPTMLMDIAKYIELIKPLKDSPKKKGVLVYVLDETPDKTALINKVSSILGKPVFRVNSKTEDKSATLQDRIAPPTEEWIKGFYEADFVITDSFHACVFSILFNKPFIVYGNKNRGLSRFSSLLDMFDLQNRLILSSDDFSNDEIIKQIDWDKINSILEKKKEHSKAFLSNALK